MTQTFDLNKMGLDPLSDSELLSIDGGGFGAWLGAAVGAVAGFCVGGVVVAIAGAAIGAVLGDMIQNRHIQFAPPTMEIEV